MDAIEPTELSRIFLSYGACAKPKPGAPTGKFGLSLFYFIQESLTPEYWEWKVKTTMMHPSEWCKIPSSWRHKTQLDHSRRLVEVRALRIIEKDGGWDIEIKSMLTLEIFQLDSQEFLRQYSPIKESK